MRVLGKYSLALAALGLLALAAGNQATAGGKKGGATLQVGAKAPSFTATTAEGKQWQSSEHLGKEIVVLYFFPAALTGG